MTTYEKMLKTYSEQIPKGLPFTEFCNKLEFAIDTDYIADNISKNEHINLKLLNWREFYR